MTILTSSRAVAAWLQAFGLAAIPPGTRAAAPRPDVPTSGDRECIAAFEVTPGEPRAWVEVLDETGPVGVAAGGPAHHIYSPRTLRDVLEMALGLSRLVDRVPEALEEVGEGERRLALARLRRENDGRPTTSAIALSSVDPLVAPGRWIPDMVQHAGATPVGPLPGEPDLHLTLDELALLDPDFLLIIAPDGDVAGARTRLIAKASAAAWSSLTAIRRKQVIFFDGRHHFLEPSPAMFDTILRLDGLLGNWLRPR